MKVIIIQEFFTYFIFHSIIKPMSKFIVDHIVLDDKN